jgi:hypothetical protein
MENIGSGTIKSFGTTTPQTFTHDPLLGTITDSSALINIPNGDDFFKPNAEPLEGAILYQLQESDFEPNSKRFTNRDRFNFKKFRRTQIAEMREVTESDITEFHNVGAIIIPSDLGDWKHPIKVSISDVDLLNESPKIGDMIARNPKNHFDQWLVAEQYFKDNFEEFKNK